MEDIADHPDIRSAERTGYPRRMKNVYLYRPDICDGDFCPMDCDICAKRELIFELEEDDE